MHRAMVALAVSLTSILVFSHLLWSANEQPPEPPTLPNSQIQEIRRIDPKDPLLQSIQERMGKLPRLDGESADTPSAGSSKAPSSLKKNRGSKVSRKNRAAEWMLKSARLLEDQAGELELVLQVPEAQAQSEQLASMAKDLRKQVRILLETP
jgi:hypothetical protein